MRYNHLIKLALVSLILSTFLSCTDNISTDVLEKKSKTGFPGLTTENFTDTYISSLTYGCQAAKTWTKENRNVLPTEFQTISKFPQSYRKAIFREHSPTVRSKIWKERLSEYLKDNRLNNKQKNELIIIINNLTGSVFDIDQKKETNFYNNADLYQTFGVMAPEIFTSLGPIFDPSYLFTISNNVPATTSSTSCVCKKDEFFSSCDTIIGPEMSCQDPDPECTDTTIGCGTFFLEGCDGECLVVEEGDLPPGEN